MWPASGPQRRLVQRAPSPRSWGLGVRAPVPQTPSRLFRPPARPGSARSRRGAAAPGLPSAPGSGLRPVPAVLPPLRSGPVLGHRQALSPGFWRRMGEPAPPVSQGVAEPTVAPVTAHAREHPGARETGTNCRDRSTMRAAGLSSAVQYVGAAANALDRAPSDWRRCQCVGRQAQDPPRRSTRGVTWRHRYATGSP